MLGACLIYYIFKKLNGVIYLLLALFNKIDIICFVAVCFLIDAITMASLFKDCREFFGSDDLYTVLNVEKDAQDSACKYCSILFLSDRFYK